MVYFFGYDSTERSKIGNGFVTFRWTDIGAYTPGGFPTAQGKAVQAPQACVSRLCMR